MRGFWKNENPNTFISTPSPLLVINFSLAFKIKACYAFFPSHKPLQLSQTEMAGYCVLRKYKYFIPHL